MNRRSFFKVVTGFVAGIFAGSVEGKKRSGVRYCGEASTSIDPNSEWAKQKYLTLAEIRKVIEQQELLEAQKAANSLYVLHYDDHTIIDDSKTIQEAIDLAKDKASRCRLTGLSFSFAQYYGLNT